jgi:hypothetical protein
MDGIYVNEKGEYKGQDANKEDKTVRVISDNDWDAAEKADDGSITPRSTANAVSKSTALSEHEAGIAISDDAWEQVENAGGEKLTPTVQNNDDKQVVVLPESYTKELVTLESGEAYYPGADGVKTAAHSSDQVYKIGNGGKVVVGNNGSVSTTKYSLGHSLLNPGIKGKNYLKKAYKKSSLHGKNWQRLYDARPR